ncbi:hypothetical protein SMKI_12G3700 [Saccharomyces mikatae IFO 1815]|uniref:GIT Spa2 homology (SHD) domain-containing protein n=1 Tax=Saccharomyces mikatae IFO 1815 TaxID=226126 RepID=A0AA35NDW1_SACMI|nr:uncharacterized protein SMKI_12G3700 [Saccharomyces mikatae IFO 1815]CAI4035221.1 hypothetical protein SMKI_12G3700 [Saccharomyces mikatae IFO 1815]
MTGSELTNDQIIDLISDYKNFKRIIENSLPEDDRRRNLSGRSNNNNLSKLSNVQFWQLATDVNNELMKRLTNSKIGASRNDLDLKRGKAQSKLSRLDDTKFHVLIFDIFTETEKRNLHNLDMMTHVNTLNKGEFNFYYNNALFDSINISDTFISVDGIIPIETLQELRSQCIIYFENTLYRAPPGDSPARLPILLETVFKISTLINDLLSLLSSLSSYDSLENEIVYLKSALSHAITSTRYFLTYGDLLPRIVPQSSISEVLFAFCNIIQIVKIKSASSLHGTLGRDKELHDTKTAMKPLKIIEKMRNKQNDRDKIPLRNNANGPVSSSISDKTILKGMSVIETSTTISSNEKFNTPVKKGKLVQNDVHGNSLLVSKTTDAGVAPQLEGTKVSSRVITELSSRDNPTSNIASTLNNSVPQDKSLPLINKFRQDRESSPSKKTSHFINGTFAGTTKLHADIPTTVDIPESPNVARMKKFKEKVRQFGPNSGLGLRISTSEEDVKNSEVKPHKRK